MTKKKIARTKRSTKRAPRAGVGRTPTAKNASTSVEPTRGPVDAEIRRAAERAGIGATQTPPVPPSPMSAGEMGTKLADTLVASIDELPANVRHDAVEEMIARLNELVAPPDEGGKPAAAEPWELTGAAFDGTDGLREECTAADLVALMWDASNRPGFGREPETFLDDVLLCAADEMEILEAAISSGKDLGDALGRYMLRAEWRFRIALEVNKRMKRAGDARQQVAGGAS